MVCVCGIDNVRTALKCDNDHESRKHSRQLHIMGFTACLGALHLLTSGHDHAIEQKRKEELLFLLEPLQLCTFNADEPLSLAHSVCTVPHTHTRTCAHRSMMVDAACTRGYFDCDSCTQGKKSVTCTYNWGALTRVLTPQPRSQVPVTRRHLLHSSNRETRPLIASPCYCARVL